MLEKISFAGMMLSLLGHSVSVFGTALTTLGFTYGINKLSTYCVYAIESVPWLIGDRERDKYGEKGEHLSMVFEEVIRIIKIAALIGVGVLFRSVGNFCTLPTTADSFNRLLYRTRAPEAIAQTLTAEDIATATP
eukprot:TRINITY_DN866_c0_g1_i1.p1 TRINITY_DN866_c0_g1~~TRINITY_DN866_c0_g1_i1.p1  ORF type:complete len:135 (+),score=13.09 TRINITY_DN866_c0_g1_i1:89-493(+)